MNLADRIDAFARLGKLLESYGNDGVMEGDSLLDRAVEKALSDNAWFTEASVRHMLHAIGASLNEHDLQKWMKAYTLEDGNAPKTMAVIMAGNIPAVGFHDLLCVLISGNRLLAKLSSDDKHLIPAISRLLIKIDPRFEDMIAFTDEHIKGFDAVIATGSNNTSRYFDYYFGKYPNIIRKNRNGIAVITGGESEDELRALGEDIFTYYGLGCRNVSKVFVPDTFEIKSLLDALQSWEHVGDHHKYRNNYDYNKSIYLVNGDDHFDNGFLLLKEDAAMVSPVSVLYFEHYKDIESVNKLIESESEQIQCVISAGGNVKNAIPPGTSQQPKLWDYADGVDTMKFISSFSSFSSLSS